MPRVQKEPESAEQGSSREWPGAEEKEFPEVGTGAVLWPGPCLTHGEPHWSCGVLRPAVAATLGGQVSCPESQASDPLCILENRSELCGPSLHPEDEKREPQLWESDDSSVGGELGHPACPCPPRTPGALLGPSQTVSLSPGATDLGHPWGLRARDGRRRLKTAGIGPAPDHTTVPSPSGPVP